MRVPFDFQILDTSKNKLLNLNKNMTKAVNLSLLYFSNVSQDKKRVRMKLFLPYTQPTSSLYARAIN